MRYLDNYLTIKQAATVLGVTPNTLRNWGADGKIPEYRHPVNNYRLYKRHDLEKVMRDVERSLRVKPRRTTRKRPK